MRQWRRARRITAACAICVARGIDVDTPQRSDDVRRCIFGFDAGVPPRSLQHVVRPEQEMTRTTGRIQRAHLPKVDRTRSRLRDLDE